MNVFDLMAKITLDSSEYEQGLDRAGGLAKKLGSGLATAAKVGTAAVSAAASGISVLAKNAISSYADFEQLSDGVKTLFGDSAQKVLKDADEAFSTAGLSANEYMETSIQSAAALINSLGGDQAKAAELMNVSITDMADNVNKMGTTMESVQNAYRGFSRGNFTMLDNLALGFAGTKEGMEELLSKAEEISGITYDISSYADIVQAIHVVQDKMGILGTTADEARGTISGSVSAMKSAWQNLVTGIADGNADFETLVGNFVESVSTVGDNILPRIQTALSGIGKLISGLAPVVADALPGLINDVLPPLISGAQTLITSVANALIQNAPSLLASAGEVAKQLVFGITDTIKSLSSGESLSGILEAGVQLVTDLLNAMTEALPTLIPALTDIILGIIDFFTNPSNLSGLIDSAIQMILALAEGLINAIPQLLSRVPQIIAAIVSSIIENAPKLLDAGIQLILKLAEGIISSVGAVSGAVADIIGNVVSSFLDLGKSALNWGKDMIDNFINGIKQMWDNLIGIISDIGGAIASFLGFSEPDKGPLSNFHTYAPDMMKLFAEGIKDNEGLITDAIDDAFDIQPAISASVNAEGADAFGMGTYGRTVDRGGRSEAVMEVDRTVFARLVYRLYNEEAERVGVNLAGVRA